MPFPGTQQLPLIFAGGLNSKVAKFSLDQPYLTQADNCVYTLLGQVQKRAALTAMSRNILGGGVVSQGAAVQVFNEELVLFDGRRVYTWDPDENVWIPKGAAFSVTANQTRILNTKIATQKNPDAATAGNLNDSGLTFYVWEDNRTEPVASTGVRYTVQDNSTGSFVVSDSLVWANGSQPKVVAWQQDAPSDSWFLTYEISGDTIFCNTISSSRPNLLPLGTVLVSDCRPLFTNTQSVTYDMTAVVSGETANPTVFFVYNSQSGLRLCTILPTVGGGPNITNQTIITGTLANTSIAFCSVVASSAEQVWVVWSDFANVYTQAFNQATLATESAVITIQSGPAVVKLSCGAAPPFNGPISVTCEVDDFNGFGNYLNSYVVTLSGSVYTGQQRGLGLASKTFNNGTDVFVNTIWPSSLQATYFTLCLTSPIGYAPNSLSGAYGSTGFEVIAKFGDQNGGMNRDNQMMAECLPFGENSYLFAGQRKGAFTSYAGAIGAVLGVAGYSILFSSTNEFNSVASNNNLHISGGIKKIYDSISVVEDNFNYFPELLSLPADAQFPAVASGPVTPPNQAPSETNLAFAGNGCSVVLSSGGNLTPGSQYQYTITYEWSDNYGQVQKSGPSVATVVTTAADGNYTATLTIPTLRLTNKQNPRTPVSIAVYRTQANLPIFYKITNDNEPLLNDQTKDFVTYVDTVADGPPVNFSTAGISSNENIYTNSQLGNIAPPACTLISLFQNRLVINQSGDPNVVWYSQNKFDLSQYNTLPLDWNTSFVEGVDSRGGTGITALGLLDANLAIFKPTSIFILSGSGPNTLDTSGQFNDAQLLVSDTGCDNQNSLVFVTQTPNSPGGLLFKSAKGIYLLGRDQSLTYIGAPVEQYNSLTITSANILAQTNEIVFTTLEGTCLVYNYYFNAWTTWSGLPAVDAVVWQGQLVILRTDGTCMIQDQTGQIWADTFAQPANNIVYEIPHSNQDSTVVVSSPVIRPINRVVTTPWVRFALQGFQAVYNVLILGQFQGPSQLKCEVAYDYNPTIVESTIINSNLARANWGGLPIWAGLPGITWGLTLFANFQFQLNFSNPRCQAVQLTMTDMTPQPSAGSTLNGLTFEILTIPGPMRLPTGNLIGTVGYQK